MLCDDIEQFIKALLSEGDQQIDLQRNELAQHFGCAPSQINYVLSTRFTRNHGYLIESRRGGGGYIRILRLEVSDIGVLLDELIQTIGLSVTQEEACAIVMGLYSAEVIDDRISHLMRAAIDTRTIALPAAAKDFVRAGILKNMLLSLILWKAKEVSSS